MNFLHPSFLWAFAGLAVPIAIHLLSRKEGKVIRVGSLRHVGESNTSQFKSIRLNEWLLLALRCLMISCIVLLLAGAQCTSGRSTERSKWLVIESGIDAVPEYKRQVDSLTADGYELHYLSPGFPATDPGDDRSGYWQLMPELGKLPADVVVISWSKTSRFLGKREPLPPNVRWISAEHQQVFFVGGAWKAGDSVVVRNGISDAFGTRYNTRRTVGISDTIVAQTPPQIAISIEFDAEQENQARIIAAAIAVIREEYGLPVSVTDNDSSAAPASRWTFWLREAMPKLSGDRQVVLSKPGTGPLIERVSKNVLHLNRTIDRDVALRENLVMELLESFYPGAATRPNEVATMPDEVAWSAKVPGPTSGPSAYSRSLDVYLVLLFLLFLTGERVLAVQRNQ